MRRRWIPKLVAVAAAVSISTVMAACEWPEGTRYVHKVFADVEVTADVLYRQSVTSQGQPVDLKLDIYEPAGDTAAERPVIIWMYPGAWMGGSKSQMAAFATDSAERGYVGVAIDYRVRPEGHNGDTTPAEIDAYEDTIAAVEWLQAHAETYRIDPDAIVAGGHSSGAANALNALYWPGERAPAETPLAGAIMTSGWKTKAATKTAGRPPVIWHHAAGDWLANPAEMEAECAAIRAVGNECEWVLYEGEDHFTLFDETEPIGSRSAWFVFERILWPLGYRAGGV